MPSLKMILLSETSGRWKHNLIEWGQREVSGDWVGGKLTVNPENGDVVKGKNKIYKIHFHMAKCLSEMKTDKKPRNFSPSRS